jgi:hypothetical protein
MGKAHVLWYLLRYRLSQQPPTMFALRYDAHFFHKTRAYEPSPLQGRQHLASEAFTMSDLELVWSLIDTASKTNQTAYLPATSCCCFQFKRRHQTRRDTESGQRLGPLMPDG